MVSTVSAFSKETSALSAFPKETMLLELDGESVGEAEGRNLVAAMFG
jgi:hypothetical protein